MTEPKNLFRDMVRFQKKSFETSCSIMGNYGVRPEARDNLPEDHSFDATEKIYVQYLESYFSNMDGGNKDRIF